MSTALATKPQDAFSIAFDGIRFAGDVGTRQAALARFLDRGFPTTKHEEWKYTDISAIAQTTWAIAPATVEVDMADLYTLQGDMTARVVFVNGYYRPELSDLGNLPAGLDILPLGEAGDLLGQAIKIVDHPFIDLNQAFWQDGVFMRVKLGLVIEKPVHFLFLTVASDQPIAVHPRILIHAQSNSQVSIVEQCVGPDEAVYLNTLLTEAILDEHAKVDHYRLQQEGGNAFHMGSLQVCQARSSNFSNCNLALGGAIARSDIHTALNDEGIECTLNGLTMGSGKQLVDNHTTIDHTMPHCHSWEVYRHVLDDQSRAVFNGKVFVRPDAQKTDAKQTNKTLLLSREAMIDTKPQLEIFADDVRCTHGAAIGQLDENSLFYLRSRGLTEQAARNLLSYAFAHEIVEQIRVPSVQAALEAHLFARFSVSESSR